MTFCGGSRTTYTFLVEICGPQINCLFQVWNFRHSMEFSIKKRTKSVRGVWKFVERILCGSKLPDDFAKIRLRPPVWNAGGLKASWEGIGVKYGAHAAGCSASNGPRSWRPRRLLASVPFLVTSCRSAPRAVPGDGRAEHLIAKGAATANAGYSTQAGWNGGESARGRHVDDERPKTGDKATHVTRLVPTPPHDTPSQRVPIHSVLMSGTLA